MAVSANRIVSGRNDPPPLPVLHSVISPFFGINIPNRRMGAAGEEKIRFDKEVIEKLAPLDDRLRGIFIRRLRRLHPLDYQGQHYLRRDVKIALVKRNYDSGGRFLQTESLLQVVQGLLSTGEIASAREVFKANLPAITGRLTKGEAILVKGHAVRLNLETDTLFISPTEFHEHLSHELFTLTPAPRVSIVVLNFNSAQKTETLLPSLGEAVRNYRNCELVFIDNSTEASDYFYERYSKKGAIHQAAAKLPEDTTVFCLKPPSNLGYDGGNNLGIDLSLRNGADFVFVLNNDTVLDPSVIKNLVLSAEKNPQAGAFGCTQYALIRGEKTDILKCMQIPFLENRALGVLKAPDRPPDETSTIETDWVQGASAFFRVAALSESGPFDTSIFAYGEEAILCRSLHEAGWRRLVVGGAKIWHEANGSTPQEDLPEVVHRLALRNALLYFRTMFPENLGEHALSIRFLCLLSVQSGYHIAKQIKDPSRALRIAKAKAHGWADAMRGDFFGIRDHDPIRFSSDTVQCATYSGLPSKR